MERPSNDQLAKLRERYPEDFIKPDAFKAVSRYSQGATIAILQLFAEIDALLADLIEAKERGRRAFDAAWDWAETFADEVRPANREQMREEMKTKGWERLQKEQP